MEYRGVWLKGAQVAFIATFLMIIFLSISMVSALTSSDVTILANLSNSSPRAGDTVLVSVTFQSKVAQELQIYALGVHADWMQADQLFGPNLSSNPATVEANGVYVTSFAMQIPSTASLGSHTYRVGVDGLDSTGTAFSVDSAESTLQVLSPSSGTGGPSTSGNPSDFQLGEWLPWITLIVAAIIVAVLVVFFVMRSKKPRKTVVVPASNEATPTPAEESSSDQKSDSENFDI